MPISCSFYKKLACKALIPFIGVGISAILLAETLNYYYLNIRFNNVNLLARGFIIIIVPKF